MRHYCKMVIIKKEPEIKDMMVMMIKTDHYLGSKWYLHKLQFASPCRILMTARVHKNLHNLTRNSHIDNVTS